MSFDLAFWAEEPPPSPVRAADVYERLADGEAGVPASPAVGRFLDDVDATFPDLTEDTLDSSPRAPTVLTVRVARSGPEAVDAEP